MNTLTTTTTRAKRSKHNKYCTSAHTKHIHTYMIVVIRFVGGCVPHDSTRIFLERCRVDRRFHGTTNENLGLHGKHIVMVGAVFGHGRVGKLCDSFTAPTCYPVCARAARIEWGTGRVDVGTESIITIRGTGNVRLTRIVGNESILLDEFVRSRRRATVTAPRNIGSTIELE
jgi:hypothetical protein